MKQRRGRKCQALAGGLVGDILCAALWGGDSGCVGCSCRSMRGPHAPHVQGGRGAHGQHEGAGRGAGGWALWDHFPLGKKEEAT